ncbi:hypothetical protein CSKR_201490 [Clonorchis sinensis]|uniref:Uncharacterized protein n=1 Tax=Clonorchis sinensis TaxID=79923 RepID=A0A8T1MS11_CLOSI|nr:hypothetical protein CSKR_201490 [Clonorchis sinensis]
MAACIFGTQSSSRIPPIYSDLFRYSCSDLKQSFFLSCSSPSITATSEFISSRTRRHHALHAPLFYVPSHYFSIQCSSDAIGYRFSLLPSLLPFSNSRLKHN